MPSSLQLKKIEKDKIGLRCSADTEGAAYAMSDLGDDLNRAGNGLNRLRFIMVPVRGEEWEREWAERYYNSMWKIKDLRSAGSLLLVSKASPTAERYNAPGGKGSCMTFRKCNRLPPDSAILAQLDYGAGTSVTDLLLWATAQIDALPDPGNNFF